MDIPSRQSLGQRGQRPTGVRADGYREGFAEGAARTGLPASPRSPWTPAPCSPEWAGRPRSWMMDPAGAAPIGWMRPQSRRHAPSPRGGPHGRPGWVRRQRKQGQWAQEQAEGRLCEQCWGSRHRGSPGEASPFKEMQCPWCKLALRVSAPQEQRFHCAGGGGGVLPCLTSAGRWVSVGSSVP